MSFGCSGVRVFGCSGVQVRRSQSQSQSQSRSGWENPSPSPDPSPSRIPDLTGTGIGNLPEVTGAGVPLCRWRAATQADGGSVLRVGALLALTRGWVSLGRASAVALNIGAQ